MKMKLLCLFQAVIFLCSFCTSLTGKAISFTPNFEINSEACLLINTDTNEVLYEKNADTQYMPGALVQIMEAALILENHETELDKMISCDGEMVQRYQTAENPDDLRYGDIRNGDVFTIDELLYALLLTSSCEAAVMLANEFGNGSVAGFVDMMNAKAQELGCTQTVFKNVTGIPEAGQVTTAREMTKITQYALSVNKFLAYSSAVSYTTKTDNSDRHKEPLTWTHSNVMLQTTSGYYMPEAKGIKTANLTNQGRSIICQGTKDGNTFLVVLLAAPFNNSSGELGYLHIEDAQQLLEWVFTHFNYQTILSDNTELGQINVQNGEGIDYVLVKPEKPFMTLWYDEADFNSVVQEVKLEDNVSAPIEAGEKLGTVTLKFSGQELTTIDLVATNAVELSKSKYYLALAKHFPKTEWLNRAIFLSVILCAVYLVLCIYAHVLYTQKPKTPEPVHLKPKASAVKKEAQKSVKVKKKNKSE